MPKTGPLKAKMKQTDTELKSGEALKKVKTVHRSGEGAPAEKRQTHSRAFLTEQLVKQKKMVAEVPKPPVTVSSSKPAPGMYKGKIVQSKIGAIWKSEAPVGRAEPKPSAPKAESQKVGNGTKVRSKSVADLHGTKKPVPTKPKSALDRPVQVPKPAVTSRPLAGSFSARPPTRTVPVTLTSTSYRNSNMTFTKKNGVESSKPKIPQADKKVNKPVSSTLSQYRFTMETAEERR